MNEDDDPKPRQQRLAEIEALTARGGHRGSDAGKLLIETAAASVSSAPVIPRKTSESWIPPIVRHAPGPPGDAASTALQSGTLRPSPPPMNLYVVFHDKVDPGMYEELDENEKNCLTLYGVKSRQAMSLRTVYEDELPLYNRRLQANKYNEGSALYHVHVNGLANGPGYVGFFHYDMKFCRGAINAATEIVMRSPAANHVFATSLFTHTPFVGGQTAIVTDYPEHNLVGGLRSYNTHFGTRFSPDILVTIKMPMRNAFIVSTQLYRKMMNWMESYFIDDISDHLYEPVENDYFNPGHVIEGLTGMFLALEVAQNAVCHRIPILLERGHQSGFPNDTSHE